jgi:ribonuclease HI
VKGYPGAAYKAFASVAEARAALAAGHAHYQGAAAPAKWKHSARRPRLPSLAVDAACSGSPGWLEYRAVDTETGRQVFRAGRFAEGTNNVGEFLAIVDALRWLRRGRKGQPVYSDSSNAIAWIRRGKCNTRLKRTAANRKLFAMIARAESELPGLLSSGSAGTAPPVILKWDTAAWGENPADFGRK